MEATTTTTTIGKYVEMAIFFFTTLRLTNASNCSTRSRKKFSNQYFRENK